MLRKILEWSALGVLTLGMFAGSAVWTVAGQGQVKGTTAIGTIGELDGEFQAKPKATPTPAKELPKEIKIPEARTDKVLLFQEQDAKVSLEQQLLVEKFKASPEWKALEDRKSAVAEKMAAELSSALKLAGVDEKDFSKYRYDMKTLKLTLAEDPPAPKK